MAFENSGQAKQVLANALALIDDAKNKVWEVKQYFEGVGLDLEDEGQDIACADFVGSLDDLYGSIDYAVDEFPHEDEYPDLP